MSGNPAQIRKATSRIMRAINGMHPVDVGGALETVVANLVCDWSANADDANRGLDAMVGDMRNVIKMRFASQGSVQ